MSRKDTGAQPDIMVLEPTRSQEGYRIAKDPQNWILQAGRYPDPKHKDTKDPDKVRWRDVGYYQSVTSLVEAFHRHVAMASRKKLPDSLNEATDATYKLLERIQKGLEVRIRA